jgi:hypothetical protein
MIGVSITFISTLISVFKRHRILALENLALRQQLAVFKRCHPGPKLQPTDRVPFARQPDILKTVSGWHAVGPTFICGGLVMHSTIPAEFLDLKARFETWRATRKYLREPIPDELRQAAAEMTRCYPPSLVGRILKLDPSRLRRPATKKPARPRKQPSVAFFKLQPEIALPESESSTSHGLTGCRIQLERADGSRLTLIIPTLLEQLQARGRTLNAEGKPDDEIAATLAKEGYRTTKGGEITKLSLCHMRKIWRIRANRQYQDGRNPQRWEDGTYSVQGAAAAIGVKESTIHRWLRGGLLDAKQSGKGGAWKIRLTEEQISCLREYARQPQAKRQRKTLFGQLAAGGQSE